MRWCQCYGPLCLCLPRSFYLFIYFVFDLSSQKTLTIQVISQWPPSPSTGSSPLTQESGSAVWTLWLGWWKNLSTFLLKVSSVLQRKRSYPWCAVFMYRWVLLLDRNVIWPLKYLLAIFQHTNPLKKFYVHENEQEIKSITFGVT